MKLSISLPTLLLSALFVTGKLTAGAQTTEQVNTAVHEMYEEGNGLFILVMAMQDGLVKDGASYNITYRLDGIMVDGRRIPEPFQSRYMAMMQSFVERAGHNYTTFFEQRGDGMHLSDVLSRTSSLRKLRMHMFAISKEDKRVKASLAALKNDGMDIEGMHTKLTYTPKGIFYAGKPLEGGLAEKYKALITAETGYAPKGADDEFSLSQL